MATGERSKPARAGAALWDQTDCAAWEAALRAYPLAVERHGGERLAALDRWYQTELPTAIRARQPLHLTRDELLIIVRWKMHRGVWRAGNLRLAESNEPDEVAACSAAAFAAAPDPVQPVRTLARLRGVGPATASAALAAVFPERYPFLDDVIAVQIPALGPPAFTPRFYAAYADALRERAAALAARCPSAGWTAQAVGLALWATAEPTAP